MTTAVAKANEKRQPMHYADDYKGLRVLEVRDDGTAVVSTEGLYRVVTQPAGRITDELLEQELAQLGVDAYNEIGNSELRAEMIDYTEVHRRERSAGR
jgi:hypothetical protein